MKSLRNVRCSVRVACVLSLGLALHNDASHADDAVRPTIAERIVVRTNAAREGKQLAPLKSNEQLTAAARQLAEFMARTGQFGHEADGRTVAKRVTAQGYQWMFVAENIAMRSGDVAAEPDAAARQFVHQWWNSQGHRENILSPQPTELGVATAVSPTGAVYAVQVFAAPASQP